MTLIVSCGQVGAEVMVEYSSTQSQPSAGQSHQQFPASCFCPADKVKKRQQWIWMRWTSWKCWSHGRCPSHSGAHCSKPPWSHGQGRRRMRGKHRRLSWQGARLTLRLFLASALLVQTVLVLLVRACLKRVTSTKLLYQSKPNPLSCNFIVIKSFLFLFLSFFYLIGRSSHLTQGLSSN